jgi:hypothetical protein
MSLTKLIVLLLLANIPALAETMDTVRTGSRNELVMKLEKEFLGARVEVITADGKILLMNSLQRRKLVIVFAEPKIGSYLVRFTKGSLKQEFMYSSN